MKKIKDFLEVERAKDFRIFVQGGNPNGYRTVKEALEALDRLEPLSASQHARTEAKKRARHTGVPRTRQEG